jgi:hypothetical protein
MCVVYVVPLLLQATIALRAGLTPDINLFQTLAQISKASTA